MADKFEDLRNFVAIVDSDGVNAAAARIGIAKSAVSRRLSDLETRLGVTLIDRTTRTLSITAVGRRYYEQANRILADLETLDAETASLDRPAVATISGETGILLHLVVPAIAAMQAGEGSGHMRLVGRDQSADIAVAFVQACNEGRTVRSVRDVMCAAPSYLTSKPAPVGLAGLDEHHGIIVGEGYPAHFMVGGATSTPRTALVVPDAETALAACVAGIGIAQLPDFMVRDAIGSGRLVQVLEKNAGARGEIVVRVGQGAGPSALRLADLLGRGIRNL